MIMTVPEKTKVFLEKLDLDGDGLVTPDEIEASREKMDLGEDTYQFLETFADEDGKIKIEKVLGKDSNKVLTLDSKTKKYETTQQTLYFPDFFQIVEDFGACESKEDKLKGFEKLFKFFDENGDGKLSEAEAKLGFKKLGMWKDDMDKVFEELKDDEGKVSIEGEMTCWYKITCIQFNLL